MASYFQLHYLAALLLIICIDGESIQITNAGFEEDDPYLLPNSNSNPNELIGWTLYDPLAVNRYDSPGVSHPGACDKCYYSDQGVSFNDPIHGDSPPEGNACLYLWADYNEVGSFGVEQELLSSFEPLTSYILSAKVGNQGYNCWTQWNEGTVDWCDSCDGFSGYIVQLVADNIIVAQDDNSIFIADQKWQTITVNYTTSSSDIALGKALKIRLLQKNDETATSRCLMFDDVALTANVSITSTAFPTTAFPTIVPSSSPSEVSLPPSTTYTLETSLLPSVSSSTSLHPSTVPTTTSLYPSVSSSTIVSSIFPSSTVIQTLHSSLNAFVAPSTSLSTVLSSIFPLSTLHDATAAHDAEYIHNKPKFSFSSFTFGAVFGFGCAFCSLFVRTIVIKTRNKRRQSTVDVGNIELSIVCDVSAVVNKDHRLSASVLSEGVTRTHNIAKDEFVIKGEDSVCSNALHRMVSIPEMENAITIGWPGYN